jgi:hypothetical protein
LPPDGEKEEATEKREQVTDAPPPPSPSSFFPLSDAVHRSVHQGTINQEQGILLLMNGSLNILVEKGK